MAFIDAPDGPLPVGTNVWKCYIDNEWQERMLTVTLKPRLR